MKSEKGLVLRLAFLAPIAVLASLLLLNGCFTLMRPALPKVTGRIEVEGLENPVEIHRDALGMHCAVGHCARHATVCSIC